MRFHGGAQDAHLPGGTQQLAEALAGDLDDDLVLGAPVRTLEHDAAGVRVVAGAATGGTVAGSRGSGAPADAAPGNASAPAPAADVVVHATRAVVALSPALTAGIGFSPDLPAARRALQTRAPMGAYAKAVLRFDRPWWREQGLSGLALADRGLVQMVVDVGHAGDGPGLLAAFVTGEAARSAGRLEPDARRRAIIQAVAALLGAQATHPTAYRDLDWTTEPWSLGGPLGVLGPGTLTALGPDLAPADGPLHWAGTDAAPAWNGYMEGALHAGERAAGDALRALGRG